MRVITIDDRQFPVSKRGSYSHNGIDDCSSFFKIQLSGGQDEILQHVDDDENVSHAAHLRFLRAQTRSVRYGASPGGLRENPASVEDYRKGKERALGFLVGQVMRKTGGRANPQVVNEMLRESLEREA